MPRRALIAIVTTALALVLLLSFKTPDSSTLIAGNGTDLPAAKSAPAATVPATPRPKRTTPATWPRQPRRLRRPPLRAGGCDRRWHVTGPALNTRYGPVQVQVTIANGKVTDVTALELPFDRSRSAAISQYAEPILRSEALQAQSAQIDLVSGATYTSDAYAQSLQGALDQAHG